MPRFIKTFVPLAVILCAAGLFGGNDNVELLGAGATFPYPFYSKLFDVYHQEYDVKVNYQAIGSGGGIRQLLNKTVDFGATDAFMSVEELEKAPAKIIHIPACLGAVAVTYNIPGNPELRLTPEIITDIFLGKIRMWNDDRIKVINPEVKLPKWNIAIVHRSDGSGTTFIFSDYMTKVNSGWEQKVGRGKSLKWPLGLGGKGNPGVAGLVHQIPGAIGYVELIYALSNNMPVGIIKNKSGNYIVPSIESVSLAANAELPPDTRVSLTNTDASKGYPISSFTWLIVYKEQNYNGRSKNRATTTVNLLWWIIHNGQEYAEPLHYAPLPKEAVEKSEGLLRSITYNNQTILK